MNYSDWFKIDLHIHTDKSNLTKVKDYDGKFDINELKLKLIENDVKVFSLTDHNIINVTAYENYYNNYVEGDPKLYLGCEFDIKVQQNDGFSLTYHTLLVFNEDTIQKVREIDNIIEEHFRIKNIENHDRSLTDNEIFELFHPYHFFYIPHAGGHKSIIDAYKGADIAKAQEMVLLLESAHEKVKEAHRIKHNEGFDRLKNPDFRDREDEAFINFSDNHSSSNYPTPKSGVEHEFYCIKGQPTFETIRFAFIDPKSRIKKHSDVVALQRSDNFIHSLKINDHPTLEENTLYFSPNLNVIIGGRSSGKSLLFNIIGNKIGNNKNELQSKYKFDPSNIQIRSFLDTDYKSEISYNFQEVIYIKQGDIVNYFENNTLIDLVKESGKTEEYKSAKEFFRNKKNYLNKLIEDLVELYSELIDILNSNFVFYNKDIESIFDDSYFFEYINQLENKTSSFDESSLLLNNLIINIEKFKVNENWILNENEQALVDDFKNLIKSKSIFFDDLKHTYTKKCELINETNEIIASKNSNLDSKGKEKDTANQRLKTLKSKIDILFNVLFRFQKQCQIIEGYRYNFEKSITISPEVDVVLELENNENVSENIIEGLNLNQNSNLSLYHNLVQLASKNISIKHFPDNTPDNLRKKIATQLKTIFENFDKPIEYLKYSEDNTSKNNSPGYNSEKYLETILKSGNSKIVFIDQPEDNLGNKFITDNLIDIIRDLKFQKQIFLVTHNPSIVVYGDAENIIMCTNNENKIKYQQLVLEEKAHQEKICKILDGGHYIFDQRARKYNIRKLLQP